MSDQKAMPDDKVMSDQKGMPNEKAMPDEKGPWSTLPEVVPSQQDKYPVLRPDPVLPEAVLPDADATKIKPESGHGEHEGGVHTEPDIDNVFLPSYPAIPDERSWFRRRRKVIVIGAVIAVLAVVGIVVGVVVSQTRKNQ